MKKSLRKLSLSRETLHALDSSALSQAAGAARTNNCPSPTVTAGNCDYTLTTCPDCPVT